ncbi:pyridoxamine 5'-phosphate oxidase family protein [Micromonospora craniellae]|uniref:Pyridoxamine 5'-phosphate oxidase family protein n=1 Tax=Micromonospora craniellae TaxID=2294034 RepID=A0A372FTP6_9ACTN|nr:pyridoxamine 5'-phosphate oxidase family protein [Micromonospora craniellae]QOC94034.1 pyridoxamine 5'-phosphate oxidase family protein [Micromonospora craniellae]RFS44093.1 pyridoxamine 5'-phosphate oxidase family protein [Micromonospora craniellae]
MTAEITSLAELRALLGTPAPRAADKERTTLHERDRQWLAASPFCLVATAGADGSCDVSPKGDPAGFAHVLDDRTIAIPERPGNKRADGYRNILENPHVGLIFLIPGRSDTLRINGRARLLRDAPWFDEMAVRGHRPVLAVVVEIEQIFFHCAKAFLRSGLWQPETWPADPLPSTARLIKEVQNPAETLADLERHYGPEYARKLYA